MEVYISHLVVTILRKEPRLLKSLFSKKTLTTVDILDSGDYEGVIGKLREKVVKEIVDANPADMFLEDLGRRFELFREEEFHYDPKSDAWLQSLKIQVNKEGAAG
jgi:hypothetical protein